MDFRRIPFQFSTTDPVKRQEELRKRFGLSTEKDKMHIDFSNPGSMGPKNDESSSATNSPRLQHRVPIFIEGSSEPVKSSVDNTQNIDTGRKPHVRVIPIEIEGADSTSKRHRSLSGSYGLHNEPSKNIFIPEEPVKHPVADPVPKSSKGPRVCNIPIKVEQNYNPKTKSSSPVKSPKAKAPEASKNAGVKLNGCSASKVAKVAEKKKESPEQITLKKIENILEKLKGYHEDVEKFSGTDKEKQYRYLDEMLIRCMLELDEIDTMGLNSIRLSRKEAVKKVQASIDLLESKVIREAKGEAPKESMEVEPSTEVPEVVRDESESVADGEVKAEDEMNVETSPGESEKDSQMDLGVENISITENEDVDMMPEKNEVVQDDKLESSKKDGDMLMTKEANFSNEKTETTDQTVQITEMESGTESTLVMEAEPVIEEPISESKEEKVIEADLDSCGDCNVDLNSENCSVVINEVNDEVKPEMDSSAQVGTNQLSETIVEMENSETADIPSSNSSQSQINAAGDRDVNSISVLSSEGTTKPMDSEEMQPDHSITASGDSNNQITSTS
ncbi:samui [Trichonephila clavata]|uniref:Samui n=1 Tax=Trichonephila clavata TaxID=2740835 RepID=A0A8X6KYM1_TRICU|nr:samui [Trichonephila clavata]